MDANGILAMENAAMERWRRGDPWGWTDISAEDITYFDPFLVKPVVGMAEYKNCLKQADGNINYPISEFINPKVEFFGNTAVLTYNYRSRVLDAGEAVISQMLWNTTEVYFKRAADWQIVHTHWSFVDHRLPVTLDIPLPVEMAPVTYTGILGELMGLESAAMERWRKGDPEGFIDLYAPGITYMDSGTPARINGLDAMKAEYKLREGKIHYDVQEFIDPVVRTLDNTAVLTYRFLSTSLTSDGSILQRIPWNCTEVYVKLEGQWRIVHNHWSMIKGEQA
jgi:ketosteroid isomerase-like protein